jgi:uroporphyrinogen III methyltransferase/synthase
MRPAQPLDGRTIVVTRAAAQARSFVELLRADGARVIEAPTIAIEPPTSWEPLDATLDDLGRYTWVVFTSVNGVAMVDRRLRERGQSWRALAAKQIAAIGPATAEALVELGARAAAVPDEFRAERLVARLRPHLRPGDAVLLPRAAQTRDVLVTELRRLSATVTEVPAYRTRSVEGGGTALREALAARDVNAVTFTSSSTVRNFAELFSPVEQRTWLDAVVMAAIGPITAATAAEYGLRTDIMPSEYTIPALARAITDYFSRVTSPRGARLVVIETLSRKQPETTK